MNKKKFDDYDDYDDDREKKKKKTRKDLVKNSNSPRVKDMRESWNDDDRRDD